MSEDRRPVWNRVGITALNWFAPGVGILKAGSPRLAIFFLLLWPVAFFAPQIAFRLMPDPGLATYLIGLSLYVLLLLIAVVGSMILSWRRSRTYGEARWWTRWPTITGVVIGFILLINFIALDRRPYRTFFLAAESMAPTLAKNDRMYAAMNPRVPLRRGDLALVEAPGGAIYIKRVVGLPGDLIELVGGTVMLNGKPVPQVLRRIERVEKTALSFGPPNVRRLSERFPGEPQSHDIYDAGYLALDDFPPTRVMPGHIFVLGDNRDLSADSRVPHAEGGLEQVPLSKVKGIPLFTYAFGDTDRWAWLRF